MHFGEGGISGGPRNEDFEAFSLRSEKEYITVHLLHTFLGIDVPQTYITAWRQQLILYRASEARLSGNGTNFLKSALIHTA